MKNSKFMSHLALSVVAASFLSCERPEIKKRVHGDPEPQRPEQSEDQEERKRFKEIAIDASDSRYAIDVRDLVPGKTPEFNVMIISRKASDLVTSKSSLISRYHAVDGLLTGEEKAMQMRDKVRCHFINYIRDIENVEKQSEFTLSEVNLYEKPIRNFVVHLTNPKDKTSKYIACAVPANRNLTTGDIVSAFGDQLGLWVYLK